MIIGFTLSYLLAAVSFHFYESNFLKLKKYFEYGKQKQPVTVIDPITR